MKRNVFFKAGILLLFLLLLPGLGGCGAISSLISQVQPTAAGKSVTDLPTVQVPASSTSIPPAATQTPPTTAGIVVEEFDDPGLFSQVSNNVWISGGKVHWSVSRNGGDQYVYRSIAPFSGDVRLTVVGQIDSWTNNCGIYAGIGDGYQSGISISFGFFGGGCATQGTVITAAGVDLDYQERSCNFLGNWLWIQPRTPYEATLTIQDSTATLVVPGIGVATGELPSSSDNLLGEYNTLYVGSHGDGDWPECSGSIESMLIEPLR